MDAPLTVPTGTVVPVIPLPTPIPVPVPTCDTLAAAATAILGGLPVDRSGAVHWDHVQKILYVPNA